MADIGYLWDEEKYEKVLEKHNVCFSEVVSAFEDPQGYELEDPAGHMDRWMWVGMSYSERLLSIIYSDEELPATRLITAFEAGSETREDYHVKQGF